MSTMPDGDPGGRRGGTGHDTPPGAPAQGGVPGDERYDSTSYGQVPGQAQPGWAAAPPRPDVHVTGRRVVQYLIDSFLVSLIPSLISIPFDRSDHTWINVVGGFVFFAVFVLIGFLYWVLLAHKQDGQTPGMKLLGLRVISKGGGPANMGQLAIRWICLILDAIPYTWPFTGLVGFIVILCSHDRQRIGDHLARTLVIATRPRLPALAPAQNAAHHEIVTNRDHTDTLSKVRVGAVSSWRAAGISGTQLAALVRSGELVKIRYGVYAEASLVTRAEADPRLGHALKVAAVTDKTRKDVASHHSAAVLLGLSLLSQPPAGTVTLTVPAGTRTGRYNRKGVIRHAAELPAEHVTALYGLPVTTAARTVADIARTGTFMDGVVVADSALYERRTSKTELNRVLASCDRWPGVGRARKVADFANSVTESPLESCARVFFRDHGLPPPEQQINILDRSGRFIARTDFLWRRYWTIAEADGLMKYSAREDAIAQLKRDRLLRETGYEVVHFTWHELFADPAAIVSRIRTAFTRAIRLGQSPSPTDQAD